MPAAEVALITGAATGIGRATALRLARAGNHIAINYSRSEDVAELVYAVIHHAPLVTGGNLVIDGGMFM